MMGKTEWKGMRQECADWSYFSGDLYWACKDWQDDPQGREVWDVRDVLSRQARHAAKIADWLEEHRDIDTTLLWGLHEEYEALVRSKDWVPTPESIIRALKLTRRLVERIYHKEVAAQGSRTPDEMRNDWIYFKCCQAIPYKSIIRELDTKPDDWERIGTAQGIKAAAKRYAKEHGLPLPETRQPGRPPKQKN